MKVAVPLHAAATRVPSIETNGSPTISNLRSGNAVHAETSHAETTALPSATPPKTGPGECLATRWTRRSRARPPPRRRSSAESAIELVPSEIRRQIVETCGEADFDRSQDFVAPYVFITGCPFFGILC